jgi:hypothetical protein
LEFTCYAEQLSVPWFSRIFFHSAYQGGIVLKRIPVALHRAQHPDVIEQIPL